ncbi:telomere length regulation protein TEL2 homolog [Acanthaster planci]|uniref:Telomere length regulation protein TEL2 homolog n=1 Tax=Acanthaster planci TaxID=133434 RepID=A0A8B7YGF7_ACAPL|nr:telomere length regulation protein TEL2 homolog [Acanthaster planci]
MADTKLSVRQTVRESQNILTSSRDSTELCRALERISALLPGWNGNNVTTLGTPSEAAAEFGASHYVRFLEFLVGQFSLDWCSRFTVEERDSLIDVFFLDGVHHHAFLVLCTAVTQSSPSFKQNKCLSLLEDFLLRGRMTDIIWTQCCILSDLTDSGTQSAKHRVLWEQLLTVIVSLPDRVANRMQDKCSISFHPKQYFTSLAKDLVVVLHKVYNQLKATQDCSLLFVSQLIGRICLNGHADTILSFLLPHFVKFTADDFLWCRVCSRIIVGTPERCMESIMDSLLKKIPWYGIVSRLLGDAVLSNKKLLFLLTNKFLLLRCYSQELVPQNIIGYLADSPNRRHLVVKTLRTLLDVWGDSSAVKHTAYDQHAYLTKVMLICLGHLNQQEKAKHKSVLMQKLLSGMQCHLNSPLHKVRRLGMIAAEALTKTLEAEGPKLTFEYEKDEESRLLWSLLVPPKDPGIEEITKDVVEMSLSEEERKRENAAFGKSEQKNVSPLHPSQDNDLDSDDDLEPYDMSEDVKTSQVQTPMYIRDCIEGLHAKENRELTETSLKVAEKLARSKPDNLPEVCVEFLQVLLHLEDIYEIDDFMVLRHSAMVAATVLCPIQASQYLTTEFYDRNYNIRQRLDVLEVLAAAAQELSQPLEATAPCSGIQKPRRPLTQAAPNPSEEAEHWRDIVQKRIESKTRRFAKGRSTPAPIPIASRFAPVAGYFFFPLLKSYDSNLNTMDMMGDDFLLLGRMLYTLGIVVHAAQHAPICRQMAVSLLELVWTLRYHTEVFVRQALMFAVSMVILSMPSHLLISDLQDEMLECKLWLEDIVGKDPNAECRDLAAQTLMVLGSVVHKELNAEAR